MTIPAEAPQAQEVTPEVNPEVQEPEEINVHAILDTIEPPDDDEGQEGVAEALEAGPEEPKEEKVDDHPALPPGLKKGAWRPRDDLFTEQALKTPDGLKAAREHVIEGRRQAHSLWARAANREQRFEKTKNSVLHEKQLYAALNQQIHADLTALFHGDTNTIIDTLGRMTKRDGLKLLEELNVNAARNGRPRETSPEVAELKQHVQQLYQHLQNERQQAQMAGQQAYIRQRRDQVLDLASKSSQEHPRAARFAAERPEAADEALFEIKQRYFNKYNQPLDDSETVAILESELVAFGYQTPVGAPQGSGRSGGQVTSVSGNAEPAKSALRSPGVSPNPGLTSQVARVREMTDEERLADLANDPAFLERELGIDLSHIAR